MKLASRGWAALFGMLVATLLQPAAVLGITIRDDVPDSSYLALAASPEYASVGTFVNSWGYSGSGTLIAPDWVLLSAHELVAASSGTFTIGGSAYTSTALVINPGWDGKPLDGSDFGLVHLGSSVAAIPPAMLYTGTSELGQIGTYVGFGLMGTGLTGYRTLDNQKRAFQNTIDGDFGNPSILLGSDFDSPHTTADNVFGSAVPLPLEGCVAPGDSGGGVFLTEGAQTYLAGVISFVGSTNGTSNATYGDLSGFGRVSAYVPWILNTVPEPSTNRLLGGAALLILIGRRSWTKRISRPQSWRCDALGF